MRTKKIVIVGDSILDRYLYCHQTKGRTECDAPVMVVENYRNSSGGAANVAKHVSLKAKNVVMITLLGNDCYGEILKNLISIECPTAKLYAHISQNAPTIIKSRILSLPEKQLGRIDFEKPKQVTIYDQKVIVDNVKENLTKDTVLVVSDYNKGCLSETSIQELISYGNDVGCIILVDGKHPDPNIYADCFLIKPNRAELSVMTKSHIITVEDAFNAAQMLREQINCSWVLVTLDKDGMVLVGKEYRRHISSQPVSTADIVGAGDIVIANIAVGLAKGMLLENVWLQTSQQVTEFYLNAQKSNFNFQSGASSQPDKIVSLPQLMEELREIRLTHSIVFTNGCFDIFHAGHVYCLESASKMGDILIVGVNDDNSVHRNKGEGRPVNQLKDRLTVLSAISCVNYVVPFSDDTPIRLIEAIHPDVLVKGGDYEGKIIVGEEYVRSYGGKVVLTGYDASHSTTQIISTIGRKQNE